MLESIQGRVEDTLSLPGIMGGRVAVQPLIFNRIMDILPISGWQIIQDANDDLTVLLSSTKDGVKDTALIDMLTRTLQEQGAYVPSIRVQRVAAIPKTAAGKAPLIKAHRPSVS